MTDMRPHSDIFDLAPDRRGGDSFKWNLYASKSNDVIGAWVADMDFLAPTPVLDAVKERLYGTALGYSEPPRELVETILQRLHNLYGWQVDPAWLVPLSGVVPGLFGAARAVGGGSAKVLTQSPNYHHFFGAVEHSKRQLGRVDNHLVNGRWEMDFEQFSTLAPGASSFLLCNPHNPVGRILSRSELETVADICLTNDMMICSDEIHADILLDEDKPHIPIATLSREVEQKTITLISPSKAFNLPGIGGFALAVIPDRQLRRAFGEEIHGVAVHPGALGYSAALAAYRDSDDWLAELLKYLRGNRDYLQREIAAINGLSMTNVEATFLAWINVSELGLDKPFEHFLQHGVALSDGAPMGDGQYQRLNFACTRATLEEIVKRMKKAVAAAG
jgi:cysteine-S-conjugate beta-lyase